MQIGTPPTTVNLDFDTGSADLWVFSDELTAQEQAGHDVYKTNQAKLQSGSSWDISYGDGSGASGTVYADTVEIGGVTATSQAVEAATSVSSTFTDDTDIDGLVGLAFSTINTVRPRPAKTFFDTVKASLDQPVFAAWLKPGAPGAYDFGALNQSHYTGEIGYADVNPENGFWQVTGGAVSAGTTNIGNLVSQSRITPYSHPLDTPCPVICLECNLASPYMTTYTYHNVCRVTQSLIPVHP